MKSPAEHVVTIDLFAQAAGGSMYRLGTAEVAVTAETGSRSGRMSSAEVAKMLRSIADTLEAETAADDPGHDHKPVQHRDGKPPWCNACGLTASNSEPQLVARPGRPYPFPGVRP